MSSIISRPAVETHKVVGADRMSFPEPENARVARGVSGALLLCLKHYRGEYKLSEHEDADVLIDYLIHFFP